MPDGVIGNTDDSGSSILGSSPSRAAMLWTWSSNLLILRRIYSGAGQAGQPKFSTKIFALNKRQEMRMNNKYFSL